MKTLDHYSYNYSLEAKYHRETINLNLPMLAKATVITSEILCLGTGFAYCGYCTSKSFTLFHINYPGAAFNTGLNLGLTIGFAASLSLRIYEITWRILKKNIRESERTNNMYKSTNYNISDLAKYILEKVYIDSHLVMAGTCIGLIGGFAYEVLRKVKFAR